MANPSKSIVAVHSLGADGATTRSQHRALYARKPPSDSGCDKINRDTGVQQLAAVDAELANSKTETAAEVETLRGRRAWAAARVGAANCVK